METEIELKKKNGTTGTEPGMMIGNHVYTESEYAEIYETLSPRQQKKADRETVRVYWSWIWEFGYSRSGGYAFPTLYKTELHLFNTATGEKIQ